MLPAVFGELRAQLLAHVSVELLDIIQFSEHGVLFLSNSKQIQILGCPTCLLSKPEQDNLGNPILNGKKMLSADEVHITNNNIPPEIAANLWFCPTCQKPNTSFMPRFLS